MSNMHPFTATQSAIVVAAILLYVAVTGWITYRLRSRSSDDYMTASRAMPALVVGVLLMSEFIGAKSTVGTAQEAFGSGMAAAWSVLGASIGFVLFGLFFARRIYASGEYTISAIMAQRYGRGTMIVVSGIMIYALLLVNVGNYVSGAAALATVTNVGLVPAMLAIAATSTFYYLFGGMKGVAYVTLVHSALKIAGIVIITAVALYAAGGFAPMRAALPAEYFTWDGRVGAATVIAWTVGTVGAIFSTQYIIQAVASSADAGAARRASFYAAALCLPVGLMLAAIGVAARFLRPNLDSLYALPIFLRAMPLAAAAVVAVSLVASILVSVSTVGLGIASLIIRDFYVPWARPDAARELRAARITALVVAIVPLAFAVWVPEVLKLSFFTRALRLSIAIVAVIGLYLPSFATGTGATLGLLGAAVATTAWYIAHNPWGVDNMYVAMAVPLVVIAAERLVGRAPAITGAHVESVR